MELEDILEHMSWEEKQKALARADYMSDADWVGLAEEIIERIKIIENAVLVAIKLDHIKGLKVRVVCKAGAFSEIHGDVTQVEMGIFDKYPNTWGNFRTHDERGVDYVDLSTFYIVSI